MKRKAAETDDAAANGNGKKRAVEVSNVQDRFRKGLFRPETVDAYTNEYAKSSPYKHAVVSDLINDELLRSVRSEIVNNIHFTPKETDIYKIHQSGDLANLDGLPAEALQKLPSLLKLRDAMYGKEFREWISHVSGAGAVSGKKTDMAVNLYVPGCHLLCHDDVIGSRRVSYILYLTDPDTPWQAEWGGALRLYPTDEVKDDSGKTFKLPQSSWNKVIPPAWNQLSFFAVQPGESFHDVEEVYKRASGESEQDGGRFRMAISGWFHIPQKGEDGYEPGLEESLAEKSSLHQLQGKADEFDEPQQQWIAPTEPEASSEDEEVELTPEDLQFLIKYITPNYLTPDTVEELTELFTEESVLQLTNFLSDKFSKKLKEWFDQNQGNDLPFATSRPPHKHRYQYLQAQPGSVEGSGPNASPLRQVLDELLPSMPFRKWLSVVTGLTLKRSSIMARRFRRSLDYQLAQGYEGEDPQLEYTLCITPTTGWGGEEESAAEEGETIGKTKKADNDEEDNAGGYELYMAGDDLDDDEDGSDNGVNIPANVQSHTGAGQRRPAKRKKADPAIYQAAGEDEDDGILFSNAASWNTMSFVLRDRGTLKFVKYVSKAAPGDRYDITGCVEVEPEADDDEDDE
ncbi:Fe II 2-oxoglutarate-dependent dioxygenase like protein [Zymoseptoria brevis]|uniref:uS12 prolyl 3,4-dihydroxylase n=1 Tax=Zymoseptoria brevis TaxID=1047168 RepID=A0A0F4GPQ4_9PEZI|nr:Fe II 2-oxoglutarate-dependent dioxygenase like protein [Zymoseptoria brevis]